MDHVEVSAAKRRSFGYDLQVYTFGCKVNTYDSGLIQKNLKNYEAQLKAETSPLATQSRVHVLNTCAVTAEATAQAVRMIRKIKAKEPLATIVVTGCAAQVDTGAFETLPSADLVIANSHKGLLPQLLDQYFKGTLKDRVFKSNIFKKDDLESGGGEEHFHTRSFLKIQDGCNSFCSFCIIPYARGKSRSIAIFDIVQKIKNLESEGVKEVVLTGVHIGDYADESTEKVLVLEDLVESVLHKTSISRIRLSSLEPIEVSNRLLDLFQDPKLCPHFHMSIQSADTNVLHEMKRKYSEKEVRQSLEKISLKVPNAFVGMDVIAGFPTETEEAFENTYKVLAETPWTRLHVFPYSERSGTKAAILPQMHQMIRKERGLRLRELSHHRLTCEALKQVGTKKSALVLNNFSKSQQALSRDYWSLNLDLVDDLNSDLKNTVQDVIVSDVVIEHNDVILKAALI